MGKEPGAHATIHGSFLAHESSVVTCPILSHGSIISASDDHSIKVYSPVSGEELLPLKGHEVGFWALVAKMIPLPQIHRPPASTCSSPVPASSLPRFRFRYARPLHVAPAPANSSHRPHAISRPLHLLRRKDQRGQTSSSSPISLMRNSPITHLSKNILSLKGKKVKSHVNNEDVLLWKRVSETIIGMTISDPTSAPQKILDHHPTLSGAQRVNYRVADDDKWLVLIGISGNSTNPTAFKVKGSIHLYSRERGVIQPIEGRASAFAEIKFDGHQTPIKLFTFAVRAATGAKMQFVEIDHEVADPPYTKKNVEVYFPPEVTKDLPLAMQIFKKHDAIYAASKYGFIHLYDLESGACIYVNRFSCETIFVTADREAANSIIGVNKNTLANTELTFNLASRSNLPGANDLYAMPYQQLFASGQVGEAAEVAANSPRGIQAAIESFKQAPTPPGGLSPTLQPALRQDRKQMLEKWLKKNKLTCSEELGDLIRLHDMTFALSVYLLANVPNKVIACFDETCQTYKIALYSKKVNYTPDYVVLLQHIMRTKPEKDAEFASQLANVEKMFTHYDRPWIANPFEKEMLKVSIRQILQVVIVIATKYSDIIGPIKAHRNVRVFTVFRGTVLLPRLHRQPQRRPGGALHEYIHASTRTGQIREVERVCRESNLYKAEKVKSFLKEAKLQDQLPLIIV
ncbi:hypothetical protein DFP72DRAFT_847225 [Ephemerocybe angulata]|uniref:Uncharacterized protein n=1 Tax=Ephemerocybe angulata TaxID=980116 RepID=A0A8H6M8H1_9AGAR|nr:hypothetical protein DFP72DRAFT_847225 [Tulosesus angulatus]